MPSHPSLPAFGQLEVHIQLSLHGFLILHNLNKSRRSHFITTKCYPLGQRSLKQHPLQLPAASVCKMDIHDVSNVPEYMQWLRKHRQTLQSAQSRQGQKPKFTKSRDGIIMQFMLRLMASTARVDSPSNIRSSFVPPAYAPCVTALHDLRKTKIKDLRLETHHRGSYIVLRAVTPPDIMTAVVAIVEDEDGDVLMLQLYNQEKDLVAHGRLAEGTVMIVKEPYLKVMSDGDYGIRVDHLSDMKLLTEHDPLLPLLWRPRLTEIDTSARFWRLKGNDYFNAGGYHLAIEW